MSTSPCCPPTSIPSRTAKEAGSKKSLEGEYVVLENNFHLYVSRPKNGQEIKASIIVFHDAFGFDSARTHDIVDEMASWGYLVVAGDYFGENMAGVNEEADIINCFKPWRFCFGVPILLSRIKKPWEKVQEEVEKIVVPWIIENGGREKKIGLMGFCWGGWAVTRAANISDKFACGVGAHPAAQVQNFQRKGPKLSEIFSKVKIPVLYFPTKDDPIHLKPNGKGFQEIKRNNPEAQSIEMKTMKHGYLNRGDITEPLIKQEVESTMVEIKAFFGRHLM